MPARRRARGRRRRLPLVLVAVAVAVGLGLVIMHFGGWRELHTRLADLLRKNVPATTVTPGSVDPVNEGRLVRIAGTLTIAGPATDPQLGIQAHAALLFRHVQMYQWREECGAGDCRYDGLWSEQPIDSRRFRDAGGHVNPPFPFADARFVARGLRLGAFVPDPGLLVAQLHAAAYPVSAAALPPNLLATFHDAHGQLYAGDGDTDPHVGALRVSYRIVPAGRVVLTGRQRGSRLVP